MNSAELLAHDFARGLTPERGRFRAFLLTALNRFLINEWQKGRRPKRGGGSFTDSLEALIAERGEVDYPAEASHQHTPERLYERAWAETVLARVLERLAAECVGRGDWRFDVLRPFLSAGEDPPALADAAAQLNLTGAAFQSLRHRFRQRYRESLLDEVGQTVGRAGEVAEE